MAGKLSLNVLVQAPQLLRLGPVATRKATPCPPPAPGAAGMRASLSCPPLRRPAGLPERTLRGCPTASLRPAPPRPGRNPPLSLRPGPPCHCAPSAEPLVLTVPPPPPRTAPRVPVARASLCKAVSPLLLSLRPASAAAPGT